MFSEIIGTKAYKSEIGLWKNKNKLLTSYKYNIGGKTGFTDKAKRTLVTASRKEDLTFVVVTLDCGNDFNFHKFLYEKNFEKYQSIKVLDKGENYIENYIVTCNSDISVMIERNSTIEYKLVHKIEKESSKVYLINNDSSELIGECKIKSNDRKESKFKRWINKYF